MPRIVEMYAFVAENNGDDEGVIGMKTDFGWMPLVGADMARVDSLRPIALNIARDSGKKVKLLHFTNREEIKIIS